MTGLLAALGALAHNVLAAAVGGSVIGTDVLPGSALPVAAPQPVRLGTHELIFRTG